MHRTDLGALLLLLLFLYDSTIFVVESKKHDLQPGWRLSNNASLGSPRIIKVGEEQITSDNGMFSLAFHDPAATGDFFLSVLMGPPSVARPVWTANSNSSASEGAVLLLTELNQKLLFLSSTGSMLWIVPAAGVVAIELQDSGNLVLLNKTSHVLWSSFDNPTDTVVPGQSLATGMSLSSTSFNASSGLIRTGNYVGTMLPSGFLLELMPVTELKMTTMLRKPQPYHIWSIGQSNLLDSALVNCGSNPAVMKLRYNSIAIFYESVSSPCGSPSI